MCAVVYFAYSLFRLIFQASYQTDQYKSIIRPIPNSILHFREGKILEMLDVEDVPTWAKPVAMAVLRQVSN